jgi:hypothetical protein
MTRIITREHDAAIPAAAAQPVDAIRQDVLTAGTGTWTIPAASMVVTARGASDLVGFDYPQDTIWVRPI